MLGKRIKYPRDGACSGVMSCYNEKGMGETREQIFHNHDLMRGVTKIEMLFIMKHLTYLLTFEMNPLMIFNIKKNTQEGDMSLVNVIPCHRRELNQNQNSYATDNDGGEYMSASPRKTME